MLTEQQTGNIVDYLVDAGATTASETKPAVWADYLNDPEVGSPACTVEQATRAARRTIRAWNQKGRTYQVNVDILATEIRKLRAETARESMKLTGPIEPPKELGGDPRREIEWRRRVQARIASGLTREEAVAQVNAAAGITERPVELVPPPADLKKRLAWKPEQP